MNILTLNLDRVHLSDDQLYHVRSIDHNIPAGRVFEMVNYWQLLLVNPPLPDFGRSGGNRPDMILDQLSKKKQRVKV